MLKYYDQHVHTHHSFDSSETIENYLKKTKNLLITTEHLDFSNPADSFKDSIPFFKAYNNELIKLEEQYHRQILRGIEIGFVPHQKQQIQEFIVSNPYDCLLLSTHQNGHIDFMDPIIKKMDPKKIISEYYEQMILSIEAFPEANILTHFDYGVRQLSLSVDNFQKIAEPLLTQVFQLAISNHIAIELNAKSFIKYNNAHLYQYAIPLYLSLGGNLFTLGSDAHIASDYENGFNEMGTLLKKNGVHQLATFQKQTLNLVDF